MTTSEAVGQALQDGTLPRRLWLYSNYHCNLTCSYCLTDSAPGVARRELPGPRMLALAEEARDLGFTEVGVTGGEPFLRPEMPTLLERLAAVLPVVVLSNGTLFSGRRLGGLRRLVGLPVKIQISLDHHEPGRNDAARGEGSFVGALGAIVKLRELSIGVRVASTVDALGGPDLGRLCDLHRSLGIEEEDHVVRPVVRRGRAAERQLGMSVGPEAFPPELTVTADGAFWSPFGPTVTAGRLDTDWLIIRTTTPLSVAAAALLRLVESRPPGADAMTGIR